MEGACGADLRQVPSQAPACSGSVALSAPSLPSPPQLRVGSKLKAFFSSSKGSLRDEPEGAPASPAADVSSHSSSSHGSTGGTDSGSASHASSSEWPERPPERATGAIPKVTKGIVGALRPGNIGRIMKLMGPKVFVCLGGGASQLKFCGWAKLPQC
jgi:hypothetical protein